MIKIISISLIVLFAMSFIGCSDKKESETEIEKSERILNSR